MGSSTNVSTPSDRAAVATEAPATTAAGGAVNGFLSRESSARKSGGDVTAVSSFDTARSVPKVELKPDLEATGFSCQNAFYFANMSKIAYSTKEEVREIMQGDKGLGFDHFHWFEVKSELSEKSMFDGIEDTEAYLVANDEFILLVFRGTMEAPDWATNLSFLTRRVPDSWGLDGEGCDVHQGFDDGVSTVWDGATGIHNTIKTLIEEKGKHRKLFITGHSLGGALATVAAARLAFVDDLNIHGMYTIGSPRVFDGALATHFDSKINHGTCLKDKYFRCRNNNDIVPLVVPPPYTHVGTEIYIDRFGDIGTPSWIDRLLGRLSAYWRLSFLDGISDHSASEYIKHFKKLVLDSRALVMKKAKSFAKDTAKQVTRKSEVTSGQHRRNEEKRV